MMTFKKLNCFAGPSKINFITYVHSGTQTSIKRSKHGTIKMIKIVLFFLVEFHSLPTSTFSTTFSSDTKYTTLFIANLHTWIAMLLGNLPGEAISSVWWLKFLHVLPKFNFLFQIQTWKVEMFSWPEFSSTFSYFGNNNKERGAWFQLWQTKFIKFAHHLLPGSTTGWLESCRVLSLLT